MQNLPVLALPPEQIAQLIGTSIVWLAIILGIVKCFRIMGRPTTSRACVSGLLCILIGWFFSCLGALLRIAFQDSGVPWHLLLGLPMILCLIAAFIVGLSGLATYDNTRYTQGRSQAVWAVVLSALLAPFSIMTFGTGMGRFIHDREGSSDDLIASASEQGDSVIAKPEYNFSISRPARWITLRPESLNKLACVAMRRTNPDLYLLVVAESVSTSIKLETLTEIARSNLASAAEVLDQKEELVVVNGRTFAHVMTRARTSRVNRVLEYDQWLYTERGFTWQFTCWGQDISRESLASQARAIVETFKVLDPQKSGSGQGRLTDVTRDDAGYATKLAGMGWNTFNAAKENNALMDFGAQRAYEALVVIPLRFDSGEPPDLEALAKGLLHTLDFSYSTNGDYVSKHLPQEDKTEALEITTQRKINGAEYSYVLRVIRGEHSAHLLAGWAEISQGDLGLVRRSLDAITVHAPRGEAASLNEEQKQALGIVLNEAGLSYFERKKFDKACQWWEAAFKTTLTDPVILENLGNALEKAEKYKEGRDQLAPYVSRFSRDFALATRYARLQWLSGDHEAACLSFRTAIDNGLEDEDELLSWLSLLTADKHAAEAAQCGEAWVARHPTVTARRWLAQVTFHSGKEKEALAMLEKLWTEHPEDKKVGYDLGSYYNDAGENVKAGALAEQLLKEDKESVRALMILGWSQMGQKWYRDAKATFEQAAKASPEDTDIQDSIRRASAMLGQGDNSAIREPIDPVTLPEAVAAALEKSTPPEDFGKGHSSAWVKRAAGWHFEKGQPLRKTVYRKVKIVTIEGAREFSSVDFLFDPLQERVFLNRLEVKDAGGQSVGTASVEDAYVRDYDDGTATHQKVLHIPVPGVKPGCTIEWAITTQDRFTSEAFSFERYLFSNTLPVHAESIFVTGDVEQIKTLVAQGDTLEKFTEDKAVAWVAHDLPATADEPMAIWMERRRPMLWLGSDEGSWQKVAQEYLKEIADRLEPDASVTRLAEELTHDLTTDRDKVAAIARHVQKEYTYKAIEFGVRARRPNAGADTIRHRYGDCKDFALLLHLLLQSTGVESHLALIQTDWRLQPGMPTMDQFNHMVVHVPCLGENWLVDATHKSLDLAQYPAEEFWQTQALILDPKEPHLVSLPAAAPVNSCEVASQRSITMDGSDWKVDETLRVNGYYAASIRGAFTGLSEDEQAQKAQGILAGNGAAQLEKFHFRHLDDPAQDAVLELTYRVRNAVSDGQAASIPALWEKDYLQTSFVRDRRTAFEMFYPMHFTSDVTVTLPRAATKASLSALNQGSQSKFCDWQLVSGPLPTPDASKVHLRFEFTSKTGEHPAEAYAAYHDSWEAARRSWDRQISWKAK